MSESPRTSAPLPGRVRNGLLKFIVSKHPDQHRNPQQFKKEKPNPFKLITVSSSEFPGRLQQNLFDYTPT